MRKILSILSALTLLASCGGNKPAPEPENPVPAAPTGLVLHNATENGLTFQWDAMQYATSYAWELQKDGAKVQEGTTKNRNVIISGLTKATDYRFGVKSVNENGSSSSVWVDARTAGTVDPDPPTPPSGSMAYEEFAIPAFEEDVDVRAFPGAQGGGMWVTGGRGGKVIHVTNLNDSGSGSLRAALNEKGARTIVFDVAGIIELNSTLKISHGDVTIAGQTAPGDGICLKNYSLRIAASNVIVRFIRCRMGDEKKTEDDAMNLYTGNNDIFDVIIDHCSLSWSTDECGSFYGMTNFTLQWCILSESLRNSVHGKGKHGYGGIWGGSMASYHHNLLAHHDSRNPRLDHDYVSTLKGPVTLMNNVIYNWGDNSIYGGESANDTFDYRKYNILYNYFKPGPATRAEKVRFLDPWMKACSNCTEKTGSSTIVPGHFYLTDNYMYDNPEMTGNNWTGTTASVDQVGLIRASAYFSFVGGPVSRMTRHSAEDAFTAVLGYAGSSLKRDMVDARVVRETKNGNYTYNGSNGSTNGFIDTQADVGGWPAYGATDDELAKTQDTDGDGIPDWFEDKAGLDKTSASDGAAKTLDKYGRYTNLEMYLHYLVKDIITAQNAGGSYWQL